MGGGRVGGMVLKTSFNHQHCLMKILSIRLKHLVFVCVFFAATETKPNQRNTKEECHTSMPYRKYAIRMPYDLGLYGIRMAFYKVYGILYGILF